MKKINLCKNKENTHLTIMCNGTAIGVVPLTEVEEFLKDTDKKFVSIQSVV